MSAEMAERLDELLMQRTTGAISAPEADALRALLATRPPHELAQWELATAELTAQLALSPDGREAEEEYDALRMPDGLAERIIAHGEATVRVQRGERRAPQPVVPGGAPPARSRRARTLLAWSGWLAAAAVLVVMLQTTQDAPVASVAPAPRTAAALHDSLLRADSTTVRLAWKSGGDSTARLAQGDVVWNTRAGKGVMRIAGLTPNDRRRWQYQLWIFDRTRDARFPVDGGVFDIPAGATEVYVPIDARVPVGDATMFAITVEPPGGVVVSTRERVALIAGS